MFTSALDVVIHAEVVAPVAINSGPLRKPAVRI
jgi:hypothetical protein